MWSLEFEYNIGMYLKYQILNDDIDTLDMLSVFSIFSIHIYNTL